MQSEDSMRKDRLLQRVRRRLDRRLNLLSAQRGSPLRNVDSADEWIWWRCAERHREVRKTIARKVSREGILSLFARGCGKEMLRSYFVISTCYRNLRRSGICQLPASPSAGIGVVNVVSCVREPLQTVGVVDVQNSVQQPSS